MQAFLWLYTAAADALVAGRIDVKLAVRLAVHLIVFDHEYPQPKSVRHQTFKKGRVQFSGCQLRRWLGKPDPDAQPRSIGAFL